MSFEANPNRLLAALSTENRERLLRASQKVNLPIGTELFCDEQTPPYLYFLLSGAASVVYTSERGSTVELATLGDEGLVGWIFLLGTLSTPSVCVVQVEAQACRVPLGTAMREFEECAEFRNLVLKFAQHQSLLGYQVVACNRLHRTEARFARWLLMVQDRVHSDTLRMTQEFLSDMLGTRRTTVVEVAANLERAGGIEHRRGRIRIVNREKLESCACECYPRLKKLLDELYR